MEFLNAAAFFKRRPELCVSSGKEIVATIWQIGANQFFIGNRMKKVTKNTGAYLGTLEIQGAEIVAFLMCDPLQVPSHKPRRIRIERNGMTYSQLLATAYSAYTEIVQKKGAAA